ncbi:hypothetical protein BLNAU_22934 [Blattamonas nauphoetae]|uniref:Uncharacterized protein n=1 Tax=Blattamonas nauphoetae TaxID=2049346 RepID=A0ABQ9WRM9_9EUKA|nr:hypothetical protein BLNAU_22934 [Blattamonas nauphoetae]
MADRPKVAHIIHLDLWFILMKKVALIDAQLVCSRLILILLRLISQESTISYTFVFDKTDQIFKLSIALEPMLSVSYKDRPTVHHLLSDLRFSTAGAFSESKLKIQLVTIEQLYFIQTDIPSDTMDRKMEYRFTQFEKLEDTVRRREAGPHIIVSCNVLKNACDSFFALSQEDLHHSMMIIVKNSPSLSSFPDLMTFLVHELATNFKFCIF